MAEFASLAAGLTKRQVKIVATLGPATNTTDRIRAVMQAGADVFRFNFSHGSHEEHARLFDAVKEVARELGRHVAVLQDLQGPKIRVVGIPEGAFIDLVPGQELVIAARPMMGETGTISTTYPHILGKLLPGDCILLDDGHIQLRVEAIVDDRVVCRVVNGGPLGSNKGVNLPGVPLDVPAFTEKDETDLEFGLRLGVDWVALSFVRHGDDARLLREAILRHGGRVPVLAKIERPEALGNLDDILRAFDGLMVARGDLGIELPPEDVPVWQKTIIRKARAMGKVSIVATQMLESMIRSPRPTRAEASDVANAVLDGADAVMLSGETSAGSYPTESVAMMARIIEKAEEVYAPLEVEDTERFSSAGGVAHAACVLARDLRSRALVVLTRSGMTARSASRRRPLVPIVVFTDRPEIARQLSLWWGVVPTIMDFPVNTEDAINRMEEILVSQGMARPGDEVIVMGATPLTVRGPTNFMKVHRIKQLSGDGPGTPIHHHLAETGSPTF